MIGKYQVDINDKEFVSGMASSDYASDGGLGVSSINLDPFKSPGLIKALATTAADTNVADNIIASCEDSQSATAYDRLFFGDGAHFYTWNGTTITSRHTGSKTYTPGFTDSVSFAGYTFVTSTNDMARWNTSALTLVEDWWTNASYGNQSALQISTPHPLLVYENLLWLGDKENLRAVDGSLAITTPLTLNSNERIQALGIDPATGYMLVSAQTTQNYSDTLSSKFFIYIYDGVATKPRRKIEVEDLVLSFQTVGGDVFCGMGNGWVGKFNGNGVAFVRKLKNTSAGNGANLLYKHHMSRVRNILLVIDGQDVLGYGQVTGASPQAWFNVFQNPISASGVLSCIGTIGGEKFGIGFATNHFYWCQIGGTGAGTASLYTNYIDFPRPIFIRMVRIITTGITLTNPSGIGGLTVFDERGGQTSPAVVTFVNSVTGSTKYVFDFQFGGLKVQSAAVRCNIDTQAFSVSRVLIYYDIAE